MINRSGHRSPRRFLSLATPFIVSSPSPQSLRAMNPRKPKKLARLVPALGERPSHTRFSSRPIEEFGYYGAAFLRAAQVQRRSFRRRRAHFNSDVLPLLYLYRHAVELLIKGTILAGNAHANARGEGRTEKEILDSFGKSKHDLLALLPKLRQAFADAGWNWYWPNSNVETWDDLREVLTELSALDRGSFTFRYPVSLSGKPSASEHDFGLTTLVATLDDLAEALDTAIFGMDAEASRASSPL